MTTRTKTVLAFLPSGGENEVRILGGIRVTASAPGLAPDSATVRCH